MNIGIMGAILEEVQLIKETMDITDEKVIADRTYYSHIITHKYDG